MLISRPVAPVMPVGERGFVESRPRPMLDAQPRPGMPTFKRGGKVKKTGLAKVHKGERVLTAKQASRYKTAKLSTLKHAK